MRPVTCTQEGWASSGAASSRPEMYCELTLPGSTKVPGRMRPLVLSGKPPRPCRSQPAAMISSESGESGRAPRRPWPTKVASAPSAQATGSIKRSVEPLSPQSSVPPARALSRPNSTLFMVGWTWKPSSTVSMRAPRAVRQRTVASISAQVVLQVTCVSPLASAAQMMRRCAIDLDAMAGTVPLSGDGVMRASMRKRLPSGRGPRQLNRGRWKVACGRYCSGRCRAESPGRWCRPRAFCRGAPRQRRHRHPSCSGS